MTFRYPSNYLTFFFKMKLRNLIFLFITLSTRSDVDAHSRNIQECILITIIHTSMDVIIYEQVFFNFNDINF